MKRLRQVLSLKKKINFRIVLIIVIKNEAFRVPFFLHYYRMLGVDAFIFIDNGSTDNLVKILKQEEDVFLFYTDEDYANQGKFVTEVIQNYIPLNTWCLIIDTDEFFTYPLYEKITIKNFVMYLDTHNYDATSALLLDVYANKPIQESIFKTDVHPLLIGGYFDVEIIKIHKTHAYADYDGYIGGVEMRVLKRETPITKIPFIKVKNDTLIYNGCHRMTHINSSEYLSILFHSKFNNTLQKKVYSTVEYEKGYKKILKDNPKLNLYHEGSHEYKNVGSLVNANLIQIPDDYNSFFKNLVEVKTVTIIICVIGQKKLSDELIKSLQDQDYKKFELLIIYHNKDTPEIFETSNIAGLKYTILREMKKDFGFLMNKGIYGVDTEYRVYLDAEAIPKKDWLINLIEKFEENNLDIGIGEKINKNEESVTSAIFTRKTFLFYGNFLNRKNSFSKNLNDYMLRVKENNGNIVEIKNAVATKISKKSFGEKVFEFFRM